MSRAPAGRCSARATIFSPETPMSQRMVSAAVATVPLRMVRSSASIRVPGAWCESRRSITRQKQKGRGPEAAPFLTRADAYSESIVAHERFWVWVVTPSDTATVTPPELEITVSTMLAPGDADEVMLTTPEFGCADPRGWYTRAEMATVTEPFISVFA